jgi:hypothetical protein
MEFYHDKFLQNYRITVADAYDRITGNINFQTVPFFKANVATSSYNTT